MTGPPSPSTPPKNDVLPSSSPFSSQTRGSHYLPCLSCHVADGAGCQLDTDSHGAGPGRSTANYTIDHEKNNYVFSARPLNNLSRFPYISVPTPVDGFLPFPEPSRPTPAVTAAAAASHPTDTPVAHPSASSGTFS